MTRHSKVFVPRSVDTPPDRSEFYFGNAIFVNAPTETIKQISHFTPESGVWHTDSKHIKTKDWLEEKENVYVLTEDELKDATFSFAEWASHSDWTYLPSKKLWYNEEDEDNITPTTTEELYKLFNQQK
jgi:hypothetical protein